MTTRVFGAIRGAGVQVREVQSARQIVPGLLGSTVLLGMFRSGPDELVAVEGPDHYARVFGGLTQQSAAPLAAEDFQRMARGSGQLYVLRVHDGDTVQGSLKLYTRDVYTGLLEGSPSAKLPAQAFTMKAHNGGRWSGRRRRHAGDVGAIGVATTSDSTIDLAFSTVKDAWKGATLRFPNDDASAEYTITANTAAGVFTIAGTFSSTTEAGTDGRYTLELENVHELTGKLEALAVEIADSGEAQTEFTVKAYRDGGFVTAWEDLGLDVAGDSYWLNAINDDDSQYELDVETSFSGDPTQALQRPANFAEVAAPGGVSADGNVVTFQCVRWTRTTVSGTPFLDTVNDWTWPSEPVELTIVLTFTAATTFTVTATFPTGEVIEDLPTGTLGTPYASQHKWMPGFTARAGSVAAVSTDTMTIYARPLPANLSAKGAVFYPAAAASEGDVRKFYRIRSNTYKAITLAAGVDVSSEVDPLTPGEHTGTVAGTYDLSSGTNTFIFSSGGRGPFTLTSVLVGAATTATALAAELTALEVTRAGSAAAALVAFNATTDNKIRVVQLQDFGPDSALLVGSGGLNARLGFANATTYNGTAATIGRVQWRQELEGGIDGFASIANDDYIAGLGLASTDPLGVLREANTGLIKLAIPGVTAAEVQAAAMAWAFETNGVYYAEIPSTETTETAAITWHAVNLAVGEAQDYHRAFFPSHGKRKSPYGTGLLTAPLSGAMLGLEARRASEAQGYHRAPAGIDFRLDEVFVDLLTGNRVLDSEQLGAYGLTEVRKRGQAIYTFGDRIPGNGGRPFFHVRATLSHIGRTLLTQTTALVFQPIDAQTLLSARRLVRGLFSPWQVAGWFDDSAGGTFEDQVSIKADATNNTPSERAAGNLHVGIEFAVVGTAERVIFTLGPRGLTEAA